MGLLLLAAGCTGRPRVVHPPLLKAGDTVMFVAPAGELDEKRMELARQRLEGAGFNVRVPEELYRVWRGRFSGTDQERADQLMAAFTDPEVDAIFPGTGGYGTTRMLDLLDYKTIRRNPKVLVGFSDITGLHLAIQRRAGLVTYHSPNPMWGLGSEDNLPAFSWRYFFRPLTGIDRFERFGGGAAGDAGDGAGSPGALEPYVIELDDEVPPPKVMVIGRARGRVTGGNLSLISATMGTPYEIDTRGRILFIEDVGEAPYKVDRYLSQLRLAGKLDHLAGAILGKFTRRSSERDDPADPPEYDHEAVLRDYFEGLGVPVVFEYPAGHFKFNATLPMSGMVELDTTGDEPVVRVLPGQ